MTLPQIYSSYSIPGNLQQHMLRVAGLARLLTNHWQGPKINKQAIVQACALHDIAKPIDFEIDKQAQFGLSEQEIKDLVKLQQRLKADYGHNEHQIALKICQELGCAPRVGELIDQLDWNNLPELLIKNDVEVLLVVYCDMRIGPKGILSIEERHQELAHRETVPNLKKRIENGLKLESKLAPQVELNLQQISNEQIEEQAEWVREKVVVE